MKSDRKIFYIDVSKMSMKSMKKFIDLQKRFPEVPMDEFLEIWNQCANRPDEIITIKESECNER